MNCISCRNNSLTLFQEKSFLKLPIFYCKNCDLWITGNSENEMQEKILNLYKGQYWDERESEKSIYSDYSDVDSQGKRRNWISQYAYCRSYIKNRRNILEIGSGAGQSTYWFEKKGFTVTGIEPDERNVILINQKLEQGKVIHGFIENVQLDDKFEIIWMSHVLEHLVNPIIFLDKIKKNLNEDGILFIEVPNCEHVPTLFASIDKNPHTYHFTKKSLINISQKSGYTVLACDCFRPATKIEGAINKFCKNFYKLYPYYPRILTNNKEGRDLRIILKMT